MEPHWLPWALLGAGIVLGLVKWVLNRLVGRIDKAHDGVFATEGPVAMLRAEITTIARRLGGFMTREESEEQATEFRKLLHSIQHEAHEREGRLLEALKMHGESTTRETASIKLDVQALSRRIDAVFSQQAQKSSGPQSQ